MSVKRVYYWVNLTITQPFNTGIQRVTRCLASALQRNGVAVIPVKWDGANMVPISQGEADHLAKWSGPSINPPASLPKDLTGEWLIVPEITPLLNAAGIGKSRGMHVAAVFYDMIPLKTPEFYDASTLNWLDQYWRTFPSADVVVPISNTARMDLVAWFSSNEPKLDCPYMEPVLLAGEIPGIARNTETARYEVPFKLVAIGTREPRKNYPRVLRAVKAARESTGQDIRITIVGRLVPHEHPDLHREILDLASELGPDVVQLHDYLDDHEITKLLQDSQATIYGSYVEGFGLPVLESLWRGLPCICHNESALAEVAPGGGTLMVNMEDETEIAHGITFLARDPATFGLIAKEAVSRPLRTWCDYSTDVLNILDRTELMSGVIRYDPAL